MKKPIDLVDATPTKRLFHSIIADYDVNRSICELVDNAFDVWVMGGRKTSINIEITLDSRQQTITVEDNAGGVPKNQLRSMVAPGETSSTLTDETIGIFGVGTKRAVVALAEDVAIKTRHGTQKTFQIDFDDSWIEDPSWALQVYQIDDVSPGMTRIELQRLRSPVSKELEGQLRDHLSTTYAKFLTNPDVELKLNRRSIEPRLFDAWAFPPQYSPRRYTGQINTADGRAVAVEATGGLINESSPSGGEYGVYFYCNDRLIARSIKSFEVGFTKGLAGLPHPKVSLTRVIVSLRGDPRSMPWNSSKSDINTRHEVFVALRDWLVQVVKGYASLSRIWMGDWSDKVFRHKTGSIETIEIKDFPEANKSFLPPLPKSRPRYGDVVSLRNRRIAKTKPWTKGLYEGVVAADLISKQHLDQRNRIAFIVLDSTLEIAFKEYLVNESGQHYSNQRLLSIFQSRHQVHIEIKRHVPSIKSATWRKIDHYYALRCKLVHERATDNVTDDQLSDFRELVEGILRKLHKLRFA